MPGACLSCSAGSGGTGGICISGALPCAKCAAYRAPTAYKQGGKVNSFLSKCHLTLFSLKFGAVMFAHTKENVLSPSMVFKV